MLSGILHCEARPSLLGQVSDGPHLGRPPLDRSMALRWDELDDGEDLTPATPGALLLFAPAPAKPTHRDAHAVWY